MALGRTFLEKGRREEIRDDKDGGPGDANSSGAQDGFLVVSKELL